MDIERFRDENGKIQNRAANKESEYLFTHCANGEAAVPTRVLNKHVIPMLFLHGVSGVRAIDKTLGVRK